jgi:hypothetical protein
MIEFIANNDERRTVTDRADKRADLEMREDGGHWRVQRDIDPAIIYAQYAKYRARRRWAIAIIAALSVVSWAVIILLVFAAFSLI